MKEFFIENWKLFVVLGAIIIDLILVLVFKKRSTIVDNSIVYQVAKWIEEAEALYKNGSDKLSFVLSKAKEYLGKDYSKTQVETLIEWLLTLPEKKNK